MKNKEHFRIVRNKGSFALARTGYRQCPCSLSHPVSMERLQRDINAILEQGENYARDNEGKDPEKAARIRKQMDVLKVKYAFCCSLFLLYMNNYYYAVNCQKPAL